MEIKVIGKSVRSLDDVSAGCPDETEDSGRAKGTSSLQFSMYVTGSRCQQRYEIHDVCEQHSYIKVPRSFTCLDVTINQRNCAVVPMFYLAAASTYRRR